MISIPPHGIGVSPQIKQQKARLAVFLKLGLGFATDFAVKKGTRNGSEGERGTIRVLSIISVCCQSSWTDAPQQTAFS
jgi:hypothetical protein